MSITTIQEISEALTGMDHPLAPIWCQNDIIKKNKAISFDYWLEDTGIPITLMDFVEQYLAHAEYLGEMFSSGIELDNG
ncbi:hypothetical protein L1999_26635 [Neobacillus drentensis]|uniref:hypothetical protein n=1 Tax=Neobacillus drentensis TaxID=220684 RepID=UPI001F1C5CCE|nr:hypothetical protein [Neobacillus drentensis]ULT56572.1 hypothetical protein L1999_26635 [Neobacillus drentensis]